MPNRIHDLSRRARSVHTAASVARHDAGFTLIELLVVVVVIGVLIAIAIPVYLNHQKSSHDKQSQSDAKNAVAVLETCNSENAKYPTAGFSLSATGTAGTCATQKIAVSSGTTLSYYPKSDATGYLVVSSNSGGSGNYYCYASKAGGSVATRTGTAPTTYADAC